MTRIILLYFLFVVGLCGQLQVDSEDLNTLLMHSTFLITGPKNGEPGKTVFGTVFILGMPLKSDPKRGAYTLVTAAHVLDDIGGNTAVVQMRTRTTEGSYRTFGYNLLIRNAGQSLYVKHATEDVAAMYIGMPDNVPLSILRTDYLADDARLTDIELHPGDEAFCLGFPLATSMPGGFPILRTGRIASYPIIPAAKVKSIVFDLFLYPGNSGGPVYYIYDNRIMKGGTNIGRWQGILGLVIQQAKSTIPEFADKPLNLGVIVPAYFIRETLKKLPDPQEK